MSMLLQATSCGQASPRLTPGAGPGKSGPNEDREVEILDWLAQAWNVTVEIEGDENET